MTHSAPIIMSQCSISPPARADALFVDPKVELGLSGETAVIFADWSEQHGDTVTSISELWLLKAPNIFVAMSPRK